MIDLSKLSDPFPAEDVEWRVSRAGVSGRGIFCRVLCYITARAIQERLDQVCGPGNWRVEEPKIIDVGKPAFAVGISIRVGEWTTAWNGSEPSTVRVGEWITKWDVAEPTNIEPAKGGFSGGMKRAGAQWGIGRYLYHLDEAFAEVSETDPGVRGWTYAKLPDAKGGGVFYWKPPDLPAWALPKEIEHQISEGDLNRLKREWKAKFAPDSKNPADLREGFSRFVASVVGEFPMGDHTCWTRDALERCGKRISETTEPNGISSDVLNHFEE